jgi:hypothetical protein
LLSESLDFTDVDFSISKVSSAQQRKGVKNT